MLQKTLTLMAIALLSFSASPTALVSEAEPETIKTVLPETRLTVTVAGFRNDEGQALVRLFNEAKGFPRDGRRAYHALSAPIRQGGAVVVFDALAAGSYAVVAIHDEDGNGKLKTNIIGVPKEGIAASNWTGGRPRFSTSAVSLGAQPEVEAQLEIQYR